MQQSIRYAVRSNAARERLNRAEAQNCEPSHTTEIGLRARQVRAPFRGSRARSFRGPTGVAPVPIELASVAGAEPLRESATRVRFEVLAGSVSQVLVRIMN